MSSTSELGTGKERGRMEKRAEERDPKRKKVKMKVGG